MSAISAIIKEIESSNAFQYEQRLHNLKSNFSMLKGNYKDLRSILDELKNPETIRTLWNFENISELDTFILEISRRFINFIAMAKALVECNRPLIRKWYTNTDYLEIYQEKIDQTFTNNELVRFIEDLRDYVLHVRLTILNARLSVNLEFEESNNGFEFVLKKSTLALWPRWSKKGKNYLSTQQESIDIEPIIDNYYNIVSGFYDWVETSLREFHIKDFQWLESKRQEIAQLKEQA